MKSVLISIQPKWVEKIASGEKPIEVRKTSPKIKTPFKCYIYCTNNNGTLFMAYDGLHYSKDYVGKFDTACVNGKVVGEFVCDRIYEWTYNYNVGEYNIGGDSLCRTCLSYSEFENYGKGKTLYGWHISDLKIYDKPKELSEFITITDCKSVIAKDMLCNTCCICSDFCTKKPKRITRPPQSWCYVEGLGE